GADQILSATVETADGARQIAAAAEEAGAASRQAAQASAEQARGAEDLAGAIEEIASLAAELRRDRGRRGRPGGSRADHRRGNAALSDVPCRGPALCVAGGGSGGGHPHARAGPGAACAERIAGRSQPSRSGGAGGQLARSAGTSRSVGRTGARSRR